MKITVLSLFPALVESYFSTSIAHRAQGKGLLAYENVNIRDYAANKHKKVDDLPYGGGAGMVMSAQPIASAIQAHKQAGSYVIYATPSGKPFTQARAKELAQHKHLILIAGRYEGIDQRIIDLHVDEELSIGDYVMASGELGCLVLADTIMRLIPGVIDAASLAEESFEDGLLEYPLYTRPEVFAEQTVPAVLLGGHHKEIAAWRKQKRMEKTVANRPDLLHNKD